MHKFYLGTVAFESRRSNESNQYTSSSTSECPYGHHGLVFPLTHLFLSVDGVLHADQVRRCISCANGGTPLHVGTISTVGARDRLVLLVCDATTFYVTVLGMRWTWPRKGTGRLRRRLFSIRVTGLGWCTSELKRHALIQLSHGQSNGWIVAL